MTTEKTDNPDRIDDQLEAAFEQLEKGDVAKGGNSLTGALAMLLSLIAIGVASYPAYELYRSSNDSQTYLTAADLDELRANQSRLQTLLDQRQQSLEALQQAMTSREAADAEYRKQVAAQLDLLTEADTAKPRDYVVAEMEYLVRMANQRLLMERDPASALSLLRSADELVRDYDGLAAHALRGALANDIAVLRAVPNIDRQGTYLQLSALIAQVPALQRTLPSYQVAEVAPVVDRAPVTFLEKTLAIAGKAFNRLAGLVDFRRDIAEVQPILPPDEVYYLRQNLILKMRIAQMALLDADSDVYADALGEALTWLAEGFDADDAVTLAMVETLTSLSGLNIAAALPDISGSLKAVRTVMREEPEGTAQ